MRESDERELEVFAEAHATSLARLAYRVTGDREAARDLVQEALLDCHRRWRRVRAADDPGAYARRVLVNRHLGSARRRRVSEVVRDVLPEPAGGPGTAELTADRDAMWRALGGLPERQRTALVLRFYEGLEDAATAEVLGCRRATVRSLVARGLAALRTDPHLADTDDVPLRRTR